MAKRITSERVKKWATNTGIVGVPLSILMIIFIVSLGAFEITGYSGDSICAGTEENPCYAYINFTVKEDVFIYPSENWSNTAFYTDPQPKSVKMYRSWGRGWREIKLNETCKGTWCGAPNSYGVKYSYAFREGKDYKIRYKVLKDNPNQDVKWGFDIVDPVFLGIDEFKVYDSFLKEVTIRDENVNDVASIKLLTPLNHMVAQGYQRVAEFEVKGKINLSEDFYGLTKTYDKKNYDLGNRVELNRQFDWKYLDVYLNEEPTFLIQNITEINGTSYTNSVKNGTYWVERKRWLSFDKKTKIKEDKNLTIGLYTDVQSGDHVEWIPYFAGVEVNEWASWTESLNVNLIGCFTMNETGTNITLEDISGWGEDLTIGGSPNLNIPGVIATGMYFAGGQNAQNTDYTELDNIGSGNMSISLWFNSSTSTSTETFLSYRVTGQNNYWTFDMITNGTIRFFSHADASAQILSPTQYDDGNLYHAVLIRDCTQGEFTLYINGSQIRQKTGVTCGTISGVHDFNVGRFQTAGDSPLANGLLDEVVLWNRSLTSSEVSDLYNDEAGITCTTVFPPGDTCTYSSGTWAVDCSDNCSIESGVNLGNNNLTLHGIGEFNVRAFINNTDKIMNFNPGDGQCKIKVYSGGFT